MKFPNKKHFRKYWFLYLPFSLILSYLAYYSYKEIKAGLIKYKTFGAKIPGGYEVYGIDVSHYQNIINWKAVKKMNIEGINIDYAYIKASQGVKTIDPMFFQNKLRVKNAGLTAGYYHFFVATKSAEAQANLFGNIVNIEKGDLPPVLDVETEYRQSAATIRKGMKTWLTLIERKYDIKPIIYTNIDFYKRNLEGHFDNYPIWIAHYKSSGKKPKLNKEWVFWQLSEESNINGIAGKVDFNVFNGSEEEFENLKKK